jgi:hypothetical protein
LTRKRQGFFSLLHLDRGNFLSAKTGSLISGRARLRAAAKVRRRRLHLFRPLVAECLEPRALLTGTASIAGTVWNDLDGDGSRGGSESGLSGVTVYLDLNDNNALDAGEPTNVTAADGSYSFANLDAGNYVVRDEVPLNYRNTSPTVSGRRLFAVDTSTSPDRIVELDPTSGAELRSFAPPVANSSGDVGLAFDGQTLFFLSDSNDTLYELNPATGAVLDSTVLASGFYGGIASLGGKVYVLNWSSRVVSIFDPTTNAVTTGYDLDSVNSLFFTTHGLGNASTGELVAATTDGSVAFVNATTGLKVSSFATGSSNSISSIESIGDEVFVGYSSPIKIDVFSRTTHQLLRSLSSPSFSPKETAGWGDTSGAQRVTLAAGQAVTDVNFGNQFTLVSIGGTRWQDTNGDGVRQASAPPQVGFAMYLDLNDNGQFDVGEPKAMTGSDGSYLFPGLPIGNYVVRASVAASYQQTFPAIAVKRLFVTDVFQNKIVELDPQSGAILNSFAPPLWSQIFNGLAFDGKTLYFLSNDNHILYKLDPDTGAILGQTTLPSGSYQELAFLDGQVYILQMSGSSLQVFDPVANAIVSTVSITGVSFVEDGLGEMTGPDRILGTDLFGNIFAVDPATGAASNLFKLQTSNPYGLTSVGQEIFAGYSGGSNGQIDVYSRTGTLLRSFHSATTPAAFALGGIQVGDTARRVTLDYTQNATGLDFGTTEPFPINQPPTLAAIADPIAVVKDAPTQTVNLTGVSSGPETQILSITATSSNPGLIPNPTVSYTNPQTTASLSFTPAANQIGTAVITVTLKDDGGTLHGGNDTLVRTFTVVVNDAPVLDATKTLTLATVSEDPGAPSGAVGTLVSSLVDFATPSGQLDNVTDIDNGAQLGIAVTAVSSSLFCYYSLNDGSTWTGFGIVSEASARLIEADNDNRVYCQPGLNANGTFASALTFRAWDLTMGADGGTANATIAGDGTAFSTATDGVSLTVTPVNDPPTANNLSAAETYTEDTTRNLADILVSDVDSATVTATLTLSNPAAGSLSTATSGAVTSTYIAATGVWTASGAIANVNTLLAGVIFNPAQDFNSSFTIATSVSDDLGAAVSGSKAMTGTAVNDAPQGTNLNAVEIYTANTPLDLIDIVVSDVDNATLTAKITLSNPSAGSLTTGTSGAVTSTYNAATGVWTASGAIADVNALLAGTLFNPAPSFNSNFTIATSVSDGTATTTGSKSIIGPANTAPTATNLNASETFTEDTALNLIDIVASDVDNTTVTATLTLSNAAAGSLNTGTSGAVTSTYNAGTGVWTASGVIGDVNTLLAGLTFTPVKDFNGNFTIATNISDDGAAVVTGSKALTGIPVNDAPVLDATKNPTLPTVNEDPGAPTGAVGSLVSDLVDFAASPGGLDNITDVDNGAALGIAVTGVDFNLNCYYSLNGGGNWSAMFPSSSVATLIAADGDNRIYCQPNLNVNGAFATAVTFRAWDQTSGADGGVANTTTSGGTTAFSSASDGVSLTVTPVYDPPTATNLNSAESFAEDAAKNLVDIVVTAVDSTTVTATLTLSNPAAGSFNIATSGAVTSTFNAGTGVWTASGAIANVNTLLAGLTFTPVHDFNSNFTIATSVSDGVGGATGSKAMTGIAVNDAPILDATKSPALADVNEDAGAPTGAVGTLISSLVDFAVPSGQLDNVTDVDANALPGVAIIGVASGLTCYYSLNGGNNWSLMGTVSTTSARLIAADSDNRIYCYAGLNQNGAFAAAVTFRAWDQATGTDGGTASTTTNGGVTAFSTATDSIGLQVLAVDDAPTATNLNAAESYIEDTPRQLIDIVVSDIDSTIVTATLTLSNPAAGSLNTNTSGAVTSTYNAVTGVWTASGAISNVNMLLALVAFTPAANFNGNITIYTSVASSIDAATTGAKAMTGIPVNDAPVLDASKSPALAPILEDSSFSPSGAVGTLVSDLVDFATPSGGLDNVTDVDSGALLGIAVGDTDHSLICFYSLNGGSFWAPIISSSSVWQLIAADSDNRIYCVPAFTPNVNGTFAAALTFRAWDQLGYIDGQSASVFTPGGTTPFSAATDTIKLTITPVNDAPTATNLSAAESYTEDTPLDLIDIVASDIDNSALTATLVLSNASAGSLSTATSGAVTSTYDAVTGVWTASGATADVNTLLAGLTFTPVKDFNSNLTIAASVSDGEFTASGVKAISGTAVNDAPTATNLNAAETYTEDVALSLTDIVVSDVDSAAVTAKLTLSNTSAGSLSIGTSGAVTATYNSATGVWTASGAIANVNTLLANVGFTPSLNFNGSFTIATSISDGTAAAIAGTKVMTGTAVNDAPTATNLNAAETYTEDASLNLIDIVVSDVDNTTTTAKLTLSSTSVGSLSTGSSGAVTSTFNAATGLWTASGLIADVNNLLAGVIFTPTSNFSGNFTIATSISDGVAASVTGTKAMTGTAVNDAPILDFTKSPSLAAVSEDPGAPSGAVGTLIANLVDFAIPAGQVDNVFDLDSGALLGIAVTAVDSNLTCYYSLNGGATWTSTGTVSTANARLLAADGDNRIYCQPGLNLNGTFANAVTFRAWDRTSGADGSIATTTTSGGTTAFSTITDSASIIVSPVNDAPVRTGATATLSAVLEDSIDPVGDSVSNLFGSVFHDVDGATISAGGVALIANAATAAQGTWQFSVSAGAFTDLPTFADSTAVVLLAANDLIRFLPSPDFNGIPGALTARLWDGTGGFNSSESIQDISASIGGSGAFADNVNEITLSTTITPVNDPPSFDPFTASSTAADENPQTHGPALQKTEVGWAQNINPGAPFETSQKLNFTVTNDNHDLFSVQPAIDSQGNLTYTPKPNAHGTATVTVTLKDDAGGDDTSASQQFNIVITKTHRLHNAAEAGNRVGLDVTGSTNVQPDGFIVANDVVAVINYINAKGSGHISDNLGAGPPYIDVTADDNIAADDVIKIINYINAHPGKSEAEPESDAASQPAANNAPVDLISLLSLDIAEQAVRRRRLQ